MKIYIDDFVEDLNYRGVILYVGNVDPAKLLSKLKEDNLNKTYRFEYVLGSNKLFYVENCDLQDMSECSTLEDILEYLEDGQTIYSLRYEKESDRYYIETMLWTQFDQKRRITMNENNSCNFCEHIKDVSEDFINENCIVKDKNQYDIIAVLADPFDWGLIERIKFCPYCGRKL